MSIRPGKYIEYDFPLHEVNRLAVKEANAKKPIYTMHKWWARRLSCVFRTILLASAIDWEDWDRLEPWQRDDDGDFLDPEGRKITDEREYHRRKRREGLNSAWERLYYRLDAEANAVIRWAFTKAKAEPSPQPSPDGRGSNERLGEHLASLGLGEVAWGRESGWWERIDWDAREPITVLDPFMGGGTTIVEALRLGANVVGVDLNPVAWFIVKKETDGCDLGLLEQGFRQVEAAVAEEIKQYYRTTCPCCGGQADVMYVFWVKLAPCFEQTCRRCRENDPVPLYNSLVIAKKSGGKTKDADVPRNKQGVPGMKLVEGPEKGIQFIKCPNPDCGEVYASKEKVSSGRSTCPVCETTFKPDEGHAGGGKYTCPECGVTQEILEAAKANIPPGMDRNVPLPHRMYALEVYCPHCEFKGYKNADAEDLALFERAKAEFEANRDTLNYPTQEVPNQGAKTKVDCDMEGHGYHYWYEMFNERQLLCLCRLRDAIMNITPQTPLRQSGGTSPPDPLSIEWRGGGERQRDGGEVPIPRYVYELCRKLRREATPPEQILWECLRNRQLGGLKFRRQHPLGRYIADFYCADARLVVELDGTVHEHERQAQYDQIRDEELQSRGLWVLRIANEALEQDLEGTLARILAAVDPGLLATSPPTPLSTSGEAPHPPIPPPPSGEAPHPPAPSPPSGEAPHPPAPSPPSGEGESSGSETGVRSEWQNVREYLLLAWSDALDLYNTFARYEPQALKIGRMFQLHGIVPRVTYTENNLWGTKFGRGTFVSQWEQNIGGLEWREAPSETWVARDGSQSKLQANDRPESQSSTVVLAARSSEDLSAIGPFTSAMVITDPPYYGNVMYAELADFFYVWLRTALADEYPGEFGRPLTPKDEEVVEQVTRGHGAPFLYKDHEFFTHGLTRIFTEVGGHLVRDGLLVFTFHHQANEAWASVLQTALDAGFYMTAVVPVHAEMLQNLHIANKANISYDAVIVCRKQEAEPPRAEWRDIEDRVFVRAEQLVRELEQRTNGNRLAPEDIYVIAIGKCMEEYSKHYWRGRSYVTKGGQPVGIEEALNGDEGRGIRGIGEIVDQLVEEAEGRMWPAGLDPVSRFYVVNFLGQTEVPYDRLHRRLRHNVHITLDDLERRQLVKQTRGKVKVLSEKEREDFLLAIHSAEEPEQASLELGLPEVTELTYIDKVHLLTVLDQQGVMTGGLREEYSRDATFRDLVTSIAQYLDPSAPGYKAYQDLAGQVTGQGRMDL